MLCERCKKNEATCYYREEINGAAKTFHLCSACMKELENSGEIGKFKHDNFFTDPVTSLFNSLFAPMGGVGTKTLRDNRPAETEKCSLCGATFGELVREGKAGCPKCYEVFADQLDESIRRIHGRSRHNGTAPRVIQEKNQAAEKLRQLESELKEAISVENYERAAQLRDEIKALKSAENKD